MCMSCVSELPALTTLLVEIFDKQAKLPEGWSNHSNRSIGRSRIGNLQGCFQDPHLWLVSGEFTEHENLNASVYT